MFRELIWGTATRVTACSGNRPGEQQQESQRVPETDPGLSNKSHTVSREQNKGGATGAEPRPGNKRERITGSMRCLINLRELTLGTTRGYYIYAMELGTDLGNSRIYYINPQLALTFGTVGEIT